MTPINSLQAEHRWKTLLETQPALQSAVTLQRVLVARLVDLRTRLDDFPSGSVPARLATALSAGVPVLRVHTIPVPDLLGEAPVAFCRDLAAGGAGDPADHVREAFESGRLDPRSLVAASLGRNQCAIAGAAAQLGLAADLLWLVGELSAAPLAHLVATRISAGADAEAVSRWVRGYCPICGSWPAFGHEVTAQSDKAPRQLCCSFCGFVWRWHGADTCIYCGECGSRLRQEAPVSDRAAHLDLCHACGGYLKILTDVGPSAFPFGCIDDLTTADLDSAAAERGFLRPPLATIPTLVLGP